MSGRAVRCDPGRTRPPGSVLHVPARKRPEQRLPPHGSGPECRAGEYTSHIETDGPGDTVRGAGPVGRGAGLCGPGAPRLRDPGEGHADHEPAPPVARHSGSAPVPAAHAPGPRSGLREGRPSHRRRPPLTPPAQNVGDARQRTLALAAPSHTLRTVSKGACAVRPSVNYRIGDFRFARRTSVPSPPSPTDPTSAKCGRRSPKNACPCSAFAYTSNGEWSSPGLADGLSVAIQSAARATSLEVFSKFIGERYPSAECRRWRLYQSSMY